MKKIFILLNILFTNYSYGQKYLKPNEEVIFSFQTLSHKQAYLVKDTSDLYISYRFGAKDKIEFEFPEKTDSSWSKFKYSFYLRGGGTANEGMEWNYVYFSNNNYLYIIYDTYFSTGNKSGIGIKVMDLTSNKTIDIKGNYKTRKGTLVDFRDNNLLETGEELFD